MVNHKKVNFCFCSIKSSQFVFLPRIVIGVLWAVGKRIKKDSMLFSRDIVKQNKTWTGLHGSPFIRKTSLYICNIQNIILNRNMIFFKWRRSKTSDVLYFCNNIFICFRIIVMKTLALIGLWYRTIANSQEKHL